MISISREASGIWGAVQNLWWSPFFSMWLKMHSCMARCSPKTVLFKYVYVSTERNGKARSQQTALKKSLQKAY